MDDFRLKSYDFTLKTSAYGNKKNNMLDKKIKNGILVVADFSIFTFKSKIND